MARILMVLRPGEGGAFQHVSALSEALIAGGHDVALCGPHEDRGDEVAAQVIPVNIVRPLNARDDLRAVEDLREAIRSFRPDLVHAHGSKGGVMARMAALGAPETPLISTPHGYAFAGPLARAHERVVFWIAERATSPVADRIICVCEHEARLASQLADADKLRVVHNGVHMDGPFEPDAELLRFRGDGQLIVCVAGLRKGKGVETLIAAFSSLLPRNPGARLALVGDGPAREMVEAQIELGALEEFVRIVGNVDEVAPAVLAADMFVSPSWSESFPYSILEAMTLGAPIVATDVGGVAEAITDGETGLLVEPRSTPKLASALEALLADRAQAAALGEAASLAARSRFTLSHMVAGTFAVYGELLPEFWAAERA